MTEIEKVIRGIERCREVCCDECQEEKASHYPLDCEAYDRFVDRAVALLKEQDSKIKSLEQTIEDICCG